MKPLEAIAAIVAVLTGIGVSIAAARVIHQPLVQTVVAGLGGWILGSLLGTLLWLRNPAPEAPVLAVKWTLTQVGVGMVVVVFGSAALHAVFSVANLIHPYLGSWRHLLAGVAGALTGCVGYASGAGFGEPLK